MTLACSGCGTPQPSSSVFDEVVAAWPSQREVSYVCPRCGAPAVLRVIDRALILGKRDRVGGSVGTFVEACRQSLADLDARWDGDGLAVRVRDRRWYVPAASDHALG